MNLFDIPNPLPNEEVFDPLMPDNGILIERIVSSGQSSPEGHWYDQERDEWVVLIQGRAKLVWEDEKTLEMGSGDWLFIPAHQRHRVEWTSEDPPCIWLAVHGKLR